MLVVCGTITIRSYMPGFFEALQKLPEPRIKKHFITVQGKEHEVSLKKKVWAIEQGEENLIIQDGEIVRKPTEAFARYPILQKAETGYFFEADDIHWPKNIGKGGVRWQKKSE
mgnify:CR=1 FL=1